MTTISKQPYPGVSEQKRKENLAKIGYGLRKSKQVGKLHLVKKRGRNKSSRSERDFGGD